MKIRQKLLLSMLLKNNQENQRKLANEFSLSTRTIRNDFEEINRFLYGHFKAHFISLKNGQVLLNADSKQMEQIRKIADVDDFYLYKLSTDERIILILSELLLADDYITIQLLAEKFYVSRGTINSDLIQVKQWCANHQVSLLSQKGRGLKILEAEAERRSLLIKLMREYKDLIDASSFEFEPLNLYRNLFHNVDLDAIKQIILDEENRFQYHLSDVAFEALIIHIALSIERHKSLKANVMDTCSFNIEKDRDEYMMAQSIVEKLGRKFLIDLPENEVGYIALHIYGKAGASASINHEWIYIQMIAATLIRDVGNEFSVNFRSDMRLYNDLSKHLSAAIFRLKRRMNLENPLKETILAEYGDVCCAVKKHTGSLQKFVRTNLSDDELTYVVLHFAAALERQKEQQVKPLPCVLVVCSTGAGTARLLLSRLAQHFQFNVVDAISLHQLSHSLLKHKVDFVISTVPVNHHIPHAVVSPFLKEADIIAINRLMLMNGLTPHAVNPTEKKGGQLNLNHIESHGGTLLMLSDVLKKDYISLDADCKDWAAAIRSAGQALLDQKVISESYIEATIENVKELGPYIVVTKHVAIPHAQSEKGVHQTAISFVRLKTPVCFGNPDNDPVKYVFMLASIDSSSHLKALADLVDLLDLPAFYETIDKAGQAEDIISFIESYEQNQ